TRTKNTINSLKKLGIKYLLTLGGDGTMYIADKLEKEMKGAIKIAHLPKTIDNNLPLPGNNSTFGYETARHIGTEIVNYLMEDAKTTRRWFLVVTMGRKTGHLAMGIGKSSGATLTLIPEEFQKKNFTVKKIIKILEGSIIKRLMEGRDYGVAIIAEGLTALIGNVDIQKISDLKHDDLGRIKFSDFKLAPFLKNELEESLKKKGINITIVDKRIGYELRSAPPTPFDLCYTRDLGYSAVKYLLEGGSRSLISINNGKMTPISFDSLKNKRTGATKIRYVNINTESYEVARKYMIKLNRDDLRNKKKVKIMSEIVNMTAKEFIDYFTEITE
ncbi:MAG: 6-phosphofructokinase, partial [Thermodesulfobacteriota bacterium]